MYNFLHLVLAVLPLSSKQENRLRVFAELSIAVFQACSGVMHLLFLA